MTEPKTTRERAEELVQGWWSPETKIKAREALVDLIVAYGQAAERDAIERNMGEFNLVLVQCPICDRSFQTIERKDCSGGE